MLFNGSRYMIPRVKKKKDKMNEAEVGSLVQKKKGYQALGVVVKTTDQPFPWHGKIYDVEWQDGSSGRYSKLALESEVKVLST